MLRYFNSCSRLFEGVAVAPRAHSSDFDSPSLCCSPRVSKTLTQGRSGEGTCLGSVLGPVIVLTIVGGGLVARDPTCQGCWPSLQ